MRIFKNEAFIRFAKKALIADTDLCTAVENAERGLIDADLGGGVIKQRTARAGAGKSSGFRTIILYRIATRAFFVYGFGKNERANINADELAAFRLLAKSLLALSDADLGKTIQNGTLIEVIYKLAEEKEITPDEKAVP